MGYSKQEILEKLIEFKNEHGCFPVRKDLVNGMPSKTTLYRVFDNLSNAIQQAERFERGELIFEDVEDNIRLKNSMKKQSGFLCVFCGNHTSKPEDYYSSLATILITRFIKLLDSDNGPDYFQAVLDCIYRVFGSANPIMRKEMEAAGYMEEFDERQIAA